MCPTASTLQTPQACTIIGAKTRLIDKGSPSLLKPLMLRRRESYMECLVQRLRSTSLRGQTRADSTQLNSLGRSRWPRLVAMAIGVPGLVATAPVVAQAVSQATSVERGMVVDCLLPGALRKLGSAFTYLTPRTVARLTVEVCAIRGGEYVLFDRADPKTALKIWHDSATKGDSVAQFRVGQIYEMGLGTSPDYEAAAKLGIAKLRIRGIALQR